MQAFSRSDKERILDILCAAFDANRSVNYIAGAGHGRAARIRALMEYSLELCRRWGKVYLSADRNACALVLHPDRKRLTAAGIALDMALVLRCIGAIRLLRTLRREAVIKAKHPRTPFSYIWFIGVDPAQQGAGGGTKLLHEILRDSFAAHRPVYLETSSERNLSWYMRAGLEHFHTEDFGYTVHFFRKHPASLNG